MSTNIGGLNQPNTNKLYSSYGTGDSSFQNPQKTNYENTWLGDIKPTQNDDVYTQPYYVPLDSVNKSVLRAEKFIIDTKTTIEQNLLGKIFIDPEIDPDLYRTHSRIWKQLSKLVIKKKDPFDDTPESEAIVRLGAYKKLTDTITADDLDEKTVPEYICLDEIVFAEKYLSRACRKFLQEFYGAISLSTFSYIYQLRHIVNLLSNEINNIKQSLGNDFGDQYENDSQQQLALQYDAWAKAAIHYTRRITKIISSTPEQLPSAEVDKITKKQAAQFQAFFAVRINAVDAEINDIVENLKRDLIDNSKAFYTRYVRPSIRMTKDVSEPFELDYITTRMEKDTPFLTGELLVATNILKGNFVSVHADLIERLRFAMEKIDAILMLVNEKKRYANFIAQLEKKAVKKKKVIKNVDKEIFSSFWRRAPIDYPRKRSLKSSHLELDDVKDKDCHPQYLLRKGGIVTGNIRVRPGVKIDGVDLSDHRHSGSDGSARISVLDIDYSINRKKIKAKKPIAIVVEGFFPDILPGGTPVIDAIIAIEVDSDLVGYEYEILYTELG